jgi:hypothetical protein
VDEAIHAEDIEEARGERASKENIEGQIHSILERKTSSTTHSRAQKSRTQQRLEGNKHHILSKTRNPNNKNNKDKNKDHPGINRERVEKKILGDQKDHMIKDQKLIHM